MKKPLKIAGGLAALFVVGSWWMMEKNPNALAHRFVTAIQDYEDGPIFETLLAQGVDPNYLDRTYSEPAIKDKLIAIVAGGTPTTGYEPMPLLFMACNSGNEDAVRALLKHKANPNVAFRDGITPLIAATGSGSPSIIRLLLEHGAEVNHRTLAGDTALKLAKATRRSSIISVLTQAGARE
ncbi:ankyrin repeat domain-containing protein [Armatimonas sp.]|uniref:ankyrin repeat domain-containing protein n=1 Tax=Armatimonas sp. TaxID=1872638 RepID=UPI00286A1566|nr:ankyrin repeat domain-containing protein [Armatimonas sp.]